MLFGSGHGKGLHDGASTVLKQIVKQAQLDVEALKL
jgi:hypothetical protein